MSHPLIPVSDGTAEALAVTAHYEQLTDALLDDAAEANRIWRVLIGPVGGIGNATDLYRTLAPDLGVLWRLIAAEWQPDDLDPLPENDRYEGLTQPQLEAHAFQRTAERLTFDIESRIYLARVRAAGAWSRGDAA